MALLRFRQGFSMSLTAPLVEGLASHTHGVVARRVHELARVAGCSVALVRQRIRLRTLPFVNLGDERRGRIVILDGDTGVLVSGSCAETGVDSLRRAFPRCDELSLDEVAEPIGVSARTLRRLALSGELPATKTRGRWSIRRAELIEFLLERRTSARWEVQP